MGLAPGGAEVDCAVDPVDERVMTPRSQVFPRMRGTAPSLVIWKTTFSRCWSMWSCTMTVWVRSPAIEVRPSTTARTSGMGFRCGGGVVGCGHGRLVGSRYTQGPASIHANVLTSHLPYKPCTIGALLRHDFDDCL
jgi:hypothetical protein